MNNNKLINIIDYYGGNDDPNLYTNSLLNKYKLKNKIVVNKINNLGILLTDSDSDKEIQIGGKNIYNLKNLAKIMN